MLAMILTRPPQRRQVSMSTLNTRFKRWAHVMAARRSDAVLTVSERQRRARPPGVTLERRPLLSANTPWLPLVENYFLRAVGIAFVVLAFLLPKSPNKVIFFKMAFT